MITYAELVGVNIAVCSDAGEQSVVINENNLLSALSVQQWYEDDRLLASALIRSITIGHGFQDGNKRTAYVVLIKLCEDNNVRLNNKDKADIINEIASKKMDISQVVELLFH